MQQVPGILAYSASIPAIFLYLLGGVARMPVVSVRDGFRHGPGLEQIREHSQGNPLLAKLIKRFTSSFGEFRMTAYAAFFIHPKDACVAQYEDETSLKGVTLLLEEMKMKSLIVAVLALAMVSPARNRSQVGQ